MSSHTSVLSQDGIQPLMPSESPTQYTITRPTISNTKSGIDQIIQFIFPSKLQPTSDSESGASSPDPDIQPVHAQQGLSGASQLSSPSFDAEVLNIRNSNYKRLDSIQSDLEKGMTSAQKARAILAELYAYKPSPNTSIEVACTPTSSAAQEPEPKPKIKTKTQLDTDADHKLAEVRQSLTDIHYHFASAILTSLADSRAHIDGKVDTASLWGEISNGRRTRKEGDVYWQSFQQSLLSASTYTAHDESSDESSMPPPDSAGARTAPSDLAKNFTELRNFIQSMAPNVKGLLTDQPAFMMGVIYGRNHYRGWRPEDGSGIGSSQVHS